MHTKLPWKAERMSNSETCIRDIENRVIVADMTEFSETEENASFIVKAVNNHDELVAALESCRNLIAEYWKENGNPALDLANAALAKAAS